MEFSSTAGCDLPLNADMIYIAAKSVFTNKMYLSAILDLKDKGIVAYAIGRNNNNQLVFGSFDAGVQKYPDAKPIFHSDRGFQYTSKIFKTKLDAAGITQSMSRVGRCIDNGPMEAFWGTLKAGTVLSA